MSDSICLALSGVFSDKQKEAVFNEQDWNGSFFSERDGDYMLSFGATGSVTGATNGGTEATGLSNGAVGNHPDLLVPFGTMTVNGSHDDLRPLSPSSTVSGEKRNPS